MSHFSRTQFPPGGWQFHQSQTGWTAPTPISSTFDQTVRMIIVMRQKNPAICLKHKLSLDPVAVGNELEQFTRLRCGWPMPTPPAPPAVITGVPTGVVGTVEEIKRLAFGSALLMDWEQSGELAVDQALAEERALVCLSCPLNSVPRYEEWLRHPLIAMLKARIPRINAMKLSTRSDAKLGLCEGLFCPTTYLVHEPSALVLKKLEQKPSVKPWGKCWLEKKS